MDCSPPGSFVRGILQTRILEWVAISLGIPEKTSTSALLTILKPLTVWITTNYGKFLKRWVYQATLPVSWETGVQVKKQELSRSNWTWNDRLVQNLAKEYVKAVYCHSAYLTHMQSIMWNAGLNEAQAGIKIARRNINNLRYADDTTVMAESEEELKSLWGKWKWRVKKLA